MTAPVLTRLEGKAVPVIRTSQDAPARRLIGWLRQGGLTIFEITASVPGYDGIIGELAAEGGLLVGAGTILDEDAARRAIAAGAQFLVSPCFVPEVIKAGQHAGIPVIPGAATPSEVLAAHKAGAAAVKLFPVRQLGGPDFVKAVRSVLPDIALVPTGGIEIDEIAAYLAAGAHAVGLGSQVATSAEIADANSKTIIERAAGLAAYA